MNDKLFIAKKCKVGFNKRADTYTGKLGYVIGHDGKKWRKEPSWEGWREKFMCAEEVEKEKKRQFDQNISNFERNIEDYKGYGATYADNVKQQEKQLETFKNSYATFQPYIRGFSDDEGINPVEFDNVPTSGFVLNRKAGGGSRGWDARATYCRVWDPRDFEFEISIPNLLFILQETTSTKGKGLEGEFVYSWDGKDLVLLPVDCEEYRKSAGFTKVQSDKVGSKEMVPGCSYKTKQLQDLIYLGRFNWHTMDYVKQSSEDKAKSGRRSKYNQPKQSKTTLSYVFYDEKACGNGGKFHIVTGLAHLASKNSDTCVSNYAELMEEFSKLRQISKPVALVDSPKVIEFDEAEFIKNTKTNHGGNSFCVYIKEADNTYGQYSCYPSKEWKHNWVKDAIGGGRDESVYVYQGIQMNKQNTYTFINSVLTVTRYVEERGYAWTHKKPTYLAKAQLEAKGLLELEVVLENGTKIKAEQYN